MDNKEERIIKYPDTRTLVVMINEKTVEIPVGLGAITIDQLIEYMEQYGDELDKQLKEIREMKDDAEKEILFTEWWQDKMFKEFAFFTGVPPQVLEDSNRFESIQDIYFVSLFGLIENE